MNERYYKIIENYIDAYNKFDTDGMILDLHKDIKFENISNNEVNMAFNGIESFKNQAEQAKHLFKEREQKITNMRFNGDQVEVNICYRGILASDLPNGLKAGDRIELNGKSIFKFKNNKIIEIKDIS